MALQPFSFGTKLSLLEHLILYIKVRRMGWAGICSTNGGKEERVSVVGRKTRGKEPLGRPRRRWLYNIRMDLVEVGVDWIGLS
jgi:hypothetical protein